jgi:hypothetical protein
VKNQKILWHRSKCLQGKKLACCQAPTYHHFGGGHHYASLTACRFDRIIPLGENHTSVVHTEITLKNALDVGKEREGLIKNHEIRQTTVQALVDTGAWTLVINEAVRNALVLPTADEVLLGTIPLEALDLTINPRKEEIIGAHGDQPLHSVK